MLTSTRITCAENKLSVGLSTMHIQLHLRSHSLHPGLHSCPLGVRAPATAGHHVASHGLGLGEEQHPGPTAAAASWGTLTQPLTQRWRGEYEMDSVASPVQTNGDISGVLFTKPIFLMISYNHIGRDLDHHPFPTPLPWTPLSRPGCPKPRPTWP